MNQDGEFLNAAEGALVLEIAEKEAYQFSDVDELGEIFTKDYTDIHVQQVLDLALVDLDAIRKAEFKVAIDAVNSVGGIVIPALLKALGVKEIVEINCEATGYFAHTPEPLPENLVETAEIIRVNRVDVGFVVDPDVDRLAIISEDGSMFNEEYSLVSIADYVLSQTPGNTVSNLSSSRALRDITEKHGGTYSAAAVGEVNVVAQMKATHAVIGGEGNGGIIYPASHYGRDSLVGIALFLSLLAKSGLKCSELRKTYPDYFISKNKMELNPTMDVDGILLKIKEKYRHEQVTYIDGVKIDFADRWVHLRKSNTEAIIRIYAEAPSISEADQLAQTIIQDIRLLIV